MYILVQRVASCLCLCEVAIEHGIMFLTGQWLYDSPLHYIQLWMDVSIVVFTHLYDSIFACLAVGQTIFNTVSIVKEDRSITGTEHTISAMWMHKIGLFFNFSEQEPNRPPKFTFTEIYTI